MNFPLKAVFFDFDGLLFNSEPVWDSAYEVFLKKNNITDKPLFRNKMLGRGLFGVIKMMQDELGLKGDQKTLVDEYRQTFYKLFLTRTDVLMPGAVDLIKKVKSKNLRVILTTGGHSHMTACEILKRVGLFSYFDLVVSSDEVENGKPAPDVYLLALKKLNVNGAASLALEDSPNGVIAARSAGITVYGVNPREEIRTQLKEAGADKVLSKLNDIEI